jgi:hypothetical protein
MAPVHLFTDGTADHVGGDDLSLATRAVCSAAFATSTPLLDRKVTPGSLLNVNQR